MKHILKKQYYVPKPTEKMVKGRINWGSNNLYPQWLNWLYYTNAIHQGIINGKVFYTVSGGLKTSGGTEIDQLAKKFEKINPDISRANELSNSFYLKCKLSLDKSKVVKIDYLPFELVRATENEGEFEISKNWVAKNPEVESLSTYEKTIQSKNPTDLWFIYEQKREGLQFQIDGSGRNLSENKYPVVPYSGAINAILTDIETSNYQLSEVVNNFSLGTILSLNNGKPKDDKDADAIVNRISDETTGSDNAGGVLVLFSNGKETEPTVLHLNGNQLNERYLSLSADVQKTILRGHSAVSGELFGFSSDGSFNASTIQWAYGIMKQNYFHQRQREILTAIEFFQDVNGISGTIEFDEIELPSFGDSEPAPARFKKEKTEAEATAEMIAKFQQCGIERSSKTILMSEPLDLDHAFSGAFEMRENFMAPSAVEIQVLNLMLAGESFGEISKALGIKPFNLARLFQKLRRGGHVDDNGSLTESGRLVSIRSQVAKLEIMYSYDVKPGYGPDVIAGSRDFCRSLVRFDRLYTRLEIESIGNDLDTNVWMYRGGWYHNPKSGKNEPSCRHYWQQHVIYKN